MRAWLPEGHLSLFVLDVVAELDLSESYAVHEAKDARGRAGYHPAMLVALLVYAYCIGKPSSRGIERATYEDVAFRMLSGDQHPDHERSSKTSGGFRRPRRRTPATLALKPSSTRRSTGRIYSYLRVVESTVRSRHPDRRTRLHRRPSGCGTSSRASKRKRSTR